MRVWIPVAALAALMACGPEEEDVPLGPFSAELAEPTGACPVIGDGGRVRFKSNGEDREALIYLPSSGITEDTGILFNWYGTGGTADQTDSWMGGQSIANDSGHVLVIPEAMPNNILEWEFRTDGANDLAFYDDLRTCITREHGTNRDHVYTTGFSAGGLWSSFLVVHRGDTLAGAVIFSGGTEPIFEYDSPEGDVPVAIVWGGPNDTWGSPGFFEVEFQLTSENMRDALLDDGHTVVQCVHNGGHTLPFSWRALLTEFIDVHTYGEESPYADGDVSSLPDICSDAG